ncbi:MAG: electron transport complex subunit RsxA [Gammaproteobacteria bacterium]|nr:electron transport complex subunit RsxA [Gammaproteobacteria bacterium]MCP4091065.1 electron transport complex subunit RsxA [Gammaproteobacteria bacterium]MCP4277409.1 electron transport complex subunit RsxA [Gammaproteobacteria bacterium]MCP4831530.1 electron transport complex subunit RsxA [Gammaproteobacteria bacterium]MCP4927753.1 electron transport complex subunit RsxA [Gammaproteobacteria bacterium]
MTDLILIIVATVLVNNFVLTKFLGLCPFLGASSRFETATGMAMATTFVLTTASGLSYLVNHYLLIPTGTEYLRLLAFMLIIAGAVQFTELVIRRTSPLLHQVLGIFLPLITTNCAVLGIALLNVQQSENLVGALAYGLGGGLGFSLVIALFAGLRERTESADIPEAFQGAAISLITAAFMALGFMGFSGMVSG